MGQGWETVIFFDGHRTALHSLADVHSRLAYYRKSCHCGRTEISFSGTFENTHWLSHCRHLSVASYTIPVPSVRERDWIGTRRRLCKGRRNGRRGDCCRAKTASLRCGKKPGEAEDEAFPVPKKKTNGLHFWEESRFARPQCSLLVLHIFFGGINICLVDDVISVSRA